MKSSQVLVLPGWHSSGPAHWQSRWESLHGYRRVDQHDWTTPRRGDWLARLDEVVLGTDGPVLLVAHSLGCVLLAAWAKFSCQRDRVQGALLVAPADTEQDALRVQLPGWAPLVREPLPFDSVVVASSNDPFCTLARAQSLAHGWGSRFLDAGPLGHLNADSGLGDWPEGHALLEPWLRAQPLSTKD
ncbi:MAG TPA: alpha/beta hydrolase [Macromonas sp.]|nr:alpha/beta hydrolase [Macromonas sp.]